MKRRIAVGSAAVFAAMCVTGMVAFACIPIATLSLSQSTASPGSHVTASIHQLSARANSPVPPPVVFHWQTANGAVLATVVPASSGTTADLTIPQDVSQSGDYLIFATEDVATGRTTWGLPARAVIHVEVPGKPAAAGPVNAAPASAAPGLTSDAGLGVGVLVLIALATAGVGFLIFGGVALVAGRAPRAERVTKS